MLITKILRKWTNCFQLSIFINHIHLVIHIIHNIELKIFFIMKNSKLYSGFFFFFILFFWVEGVKENSMILKKKLSISFLIENKSTVKKQQLKSTNIKQHTIGNRPDSIPFISNIPQQISEKQNYYF